MRLLYPLIASALITIVPFLLTFENGQDIVRGLFGYEYFALLLFIVFIKNKLTKVCVRTRITYIAILIPLIIGLFSIAWIDLQNLLAIKGWKTGWFAILPFATCTLAIVMVWKTKSFSFNSICFILFASLIVHLFALNHYAAQPLAQFPTIDYLERTAPKPIQRKEIAEEYRNKYLVTDSVTITRDYIDSSRNNVIILVESWGVPLELSRFNRQINIFDGIATTVGIHNRMYSRTRTAEREDLIYEIHRDTTSRDTTFLPKVFSKAGFRTIFLFGGDSLEQWRYKYISNIGFRESIYGKGISDNKMIAKIDSIIKDSTQKKFIVWTTTDTKFPMVELPEVYNLNANLVDTTYKVKLANTLSQIALLALNHPETRFILQGDHNPILSPIHFQEKFYKRWVPFIILN